MELELCLFVCSSSMSIWGLTVYAGCVLCQGGVESHGHMFFACPFVAQLWQKVLQLLLECGVTFFGFDLPFAIDWGVLHCFDNSLRDSLFKLSISVAIYYLQRERNSRIFGNRSMDVIPWLIGLWRTLKRVCVLGGISPILLIILECVWKAGSLSMFGNKPRGSARLPRLG